MKFTSRTGDPVQVFVAGRFVYVDDEYETSNRQEIAALQLHPDVQRAKARRKK